MTCASCKKEDCGVCLSCGAPHAQCLPCTGGRTAPAALAQDTRCKRCGHTLAVHSAAGMCLLAQHAQNPNMKQLQLSPAAGWHKCNCSRFLLPDPSPAAVPDVVDELDDAVDVE